MLGNGGDGVEVEILNLKINRLLAKPYLLLPPRLA
jgi:hypothetical protein